MELTFAFGGSPAGYSKTEIDRRMNHW